MSITQWVEKVRQKSEGEKRRIAFYIASSFTAFIFMIWIATFTLSFSSTPSSSEAVALQNIDGNNSTPFSAVSKNFAAAISAIGEKLGGFRDALGPKTEYQREQ